MNEFEELYQLKQYFESKIITNKLFRLNKEDAFLTVFEKLGVLAKIMVAGDVNRVKQYFKNLAKTDTRDIDELTFIQESIKWIFRWCSQYCNNEKSEDIKILADDIYELMGLAYAYDQYNFMWYLHSKHYIKFTNENKEIKFDFVYEEAYKIHVCYDSVFRKISEQKKLNNSMMKNELSGLSFLEDIHKEDFDIGINFEFDGFDLEDYKVFSTEINRIITSNMFENRNRVHTIVPKKEGIICKEKKEWVDLIVSSTGLFSKKVEDIIDFFTYDTNNRASDISLSYFVPYNNDFILLSESVFYFQRPAVNAVRRLAKKQNVSYERAQNEFEDIQKKKIANQINSKYEVAEITEVEMKIRPGMDLLVYDGVSNHLQVIELKYKIPIESTIDIANLDDNLEKAYNQLDSAKDYVNKNKHLILEEYYGSKYQGVIPNIVEHFVITNFSIGTGRHISIPSPIILEEHYIELMKLDEGMNKVSNVLNSNLKGIIKQINKEHVNYKLLGSEIFIPEFSCTILPNMIQPLLGY